MLASVGSLKLEQPAGESQSSLVKIASITEAKNSLSALIDGLKAGSTVLIVDRGRPVARLEPVTGNTPASRRATRPRRAGVVGFSGGVRLGPGPPRTRCGAGREGRRSL